MKSNKIYNELSDLLENNIITKDIAERISEYYDTKQSQQPNRLFTVFGVLGAALVGMGIILILAHNWDSFPKIVKTMFAFLPLLIGQFFCGFSIFKNKSVTWKETSGTFLFFAIGASIALVGQIYNLSGNLPRFLLVWTLLALPLIYLLNSKAVTMLVLIFATYYACEFGYHFSFYNNNFSGPWLYLLLILGTLPYYIYTLKKLPRANTTAVLNWLYVLSLVIVLGAFTDDGDYIFLSYILLFGCFYNLGKLPVFNSQQLRRNSYSIVGSLGMISLFFVLSFDDIWRELTDATFTDGMVLPVLLGVACAGLLIYILSLKTAVVSNLFQYAALCFVVIFIVQSDSTVGAILVNLLLVALGLYAVKMGADTYRFSILNYGLLIITLVITCRFFDTDMSFVVRGLLFVVVGIGFFVANYIMLKRQKKNKNLN